MTSQQSLTVDSLSAQIYDNKAELSIEAAKLGQEYLEKVLQEKGEATILLATGNSQLQFLDVLIEAKKIDWQKITLFHLDEYLGIDSTDPASFRFYLHERVEKRIHPKIFNYLKGDALEPLDECDRYANLLKKQPIDLCCLGIGVNGHLAFNEPQVANFNDPHWVKIVCLDQQTRWVQVHQGHFKTFENVPKYAFTLTISAILASRKIFCLATGESKQEIVKEMLESEISSHCPASVLRQHSNVTLFLDKQSAALL